MLVEGRVARRWDPANESLPGIGIRITRVDEKNHRGCFRFHLHRLASSGPGVTRPYRYRPTRIR